MSAEHPRDPRREAYERLDGVYDVRVLEPSPPAVHEPPYADDPVARGDVTAGRPVVSPARTGDLPWQDLAREDDDLAAWCAERWLGPWRRLGPPPPSYATTRDALHRLAEHVIAPTRARDHGEITLRWTRGGFGTPFFGADTQLRVEGDVFVVQSRGRVQRGRLTTLADAAEFIGFDLTRLDAAEERDALAVDPDASRYLGDVFGFAFSILEELRADVGARAPGPPVLWPEHFDVALEVGATADAPAVLLGVSPGDEHDDDPYIYASVEGREGFEPLAWREVLAADDQRGRALSFMRSRLDG